MTDAPENEPVTDEERARSRKAIEQLKRDLAASAGRPRPPVTSPGKFTEPLGLDETGGRQRPLSAEERAHLDDVRRRAAAPRDGGDARRDDDERPADGRR